LLRHDRPQRSASWLSSKVTDMPIDIGEMVSCPF